MSLAIGSVALVGTASAQIGLEGYLLMWLDRAINIAQILVCFGVVYWVTSGSMGSGASAALRGLAIGALGIFILEGIKELLLFPVRNRNISPPGGQNGTNSTAAPGASENSISEPVSNVAGSAELDMIPELMMTLANYATTLLPSLGV